MGTKRASLIPLIFAGPTGENNGAHRLPSRPTRDKCAQPFSLIAFAFSVRSAGPNGVCVPGRRRRGGRLSGGQSEIGILLRRRAQKRRHIFVDWARRRRRRLESRRRAGRVGRHQARAVRWHRGPRRIGPLSIAVCRRQHRGHRHRQQIRRFFAGRRTSMEAVRGRPVRHIDRLRQILSPERIRLRGDGRRKRDLVLEWIALRRDTLRNDMHGGRNGSQRGELVSGILIVHPAVVTDLGRRIRQMVDLLEGERAGRKWNVL